MKETIISRKARPADRKKFKEILGSRKIYLLFLKFLLVCLETYLYLSDEKINSQEISNTMKIENKTPDFVNSVPLKLLTITESISSSIAKGEWKRCLSVISVAFSGKDMMNMLRPKDLPIYDINLLLTKFSEMIFNNSNLKTKETIKN